MSDLTDFLLARIAEDEAELKGAGKWDGEPHWWMPDWLNKDRLQADIKAKRRIVALADDFSVYSEDPAREAIEDAMHILATVYADHPDYREEWRP